MNDLKLVINTMPLLTTRVSGIGRYVYEVTKRLGELRPDFLLSYYYGYFRDQLIENNQVESIDSFLGKIKEYVRKSPFLDNTVKSVFYNMTYFSGKRFDLYWEPNYIPVKPIKSDKRVASIHDFSFYLHPHWHPESRIKYFKKRFWKAIDTLDHIITGSHFSKGEIVDYMNVNESDVTVVYHGIDHSMFRQYELDVLGDFKGKEKLPDHFILTVGSLEPRKNIENALNAYLTLPSSLRKELKFCIAGCAGWKNSHIHTLIENAGSDVIMLGYMTEIQLAYLYNLADMFLYPSFYEGFGIPPLEAMACGTPAIVSNTSSMPEVCGDNVLFVDPASPQMIAEYILELYENSSLAEELRNKGLVRASEFSWEDSAAQHIHVFDKVMA